MKTVADESLKDKGMKQLQHSNKWRHKDFGELTSFSSAADVLLLIKKRPPPTPPKMADVGADEKVS